MLNKHNNTLVILVVAFACSEPVAPRGTIDLSIAASQSSNAPIHKVTGGGQLVGPGFVETYGITAHIDAGGSVSGQVEMHISGLPRVHGTVTCLQVDGTSAWIGGVVRSSQDETVVPVGREFWFRLQDNGNGADPQDRISTIRLGIHPAATCNERRPVLVPWLLEHGNISIK